MANFGWSFPPGCSSAPWDEEDVPDHIACPECGHHLLDGVETRHYPSKPSYYPYDPELDFVAPVHHPETNELVIVEFYEEDLTTMICPGCGHESQGEAIYPDDIDKDFANIGIPLLAVYKTYEDWEEASNGCPYLEVSKLPNFKHNPILERRLKWTSWYWVKSESNAFRLTTTWVNGWNETLQKKECPFFTSWILNGHLISFGASK